MSTLPEGFIKMVDEMAAKQPAFKGLAEALSSTEPSVSVRVNRRKPCTTYDVLPAVPWCPEGHYLESRPKFTHDPLLHAGCYYVQDASSMFISHVLRSLDLHGPVALLDACAAPGGKTTTAIDSLPEGSLVVANEYDYRRAEILRENLIKWGYPRTVVTRGDTRRYSKLKNVFDIIIVDAPCSGEGMMRKDTDAVAQWSPSLIESCAERQREIVDNLWGALKPGGFMIYSTCTFNITEDEEIARHITDTHEATTVAVSTFPGITPSMVEGIDAFRFLPGWTRGEGLFVTVIQKPGTDKETREDKTSSKRNNKEVLPAACKNLIPRGLQPLVKGDEVYAIDPAWSSLITKITSAADCIMPGLEVATIKGRDVIPAHALALATLSEKPEFPTVEVDRNTALEYLRRNAIQLPDGSPRGPVIITHEGHPLGWVKNLGNRSNNLYPKEWRVLT